MLALTNNKNLLATLPNARHLFKDGKTATGALYRRVATQRNKERTITAAISTGKAAIAIAGLAARGGLWALDRTGDIAYKSADATGAITVAALDIKTNIPRAVIGASVLLVPPAITTGYVLSKQSDNAIVFHHAPIAMPSITQTTRSHVSSQTTPNVSERAAESTAVVATDAIVPAEKKALIESANAVTDELFVYEFDPAKDCMMLVNGMELCPQTPVLKGVPDPAELIRNNRDYARYLLEVEKEKNMPQYSLVVASIIESQMGNLNKCNKFGYCGAFQFGKTEWKKYGAKYAPSRLDVHAAAMAAADLAHDYFRIAGLTIDKDKPHQPYLLHQQGPGGYPVAVMLKDDIAVPADKERSIVHNLCNNIPKDLNGGLCVKQYYKTKKGKKRFKWVAGSGYDSRDVAATFFNIYGMELNRLVMGAKEALSEDTIALNMERGNV